MKESIVNFKHLDNAKSTYLKHLFYATKFNFISLLIFITGLIHSLLPFLFAYTPYKLAKYIVTETEKHLGRPKEEIK
ncbi:MAG: hypothetical protein ISP77_04060 [Methylophilaceae bacterium]|nr:hypothetical protein [Methylophilaceae bacterium]MBL6726997.1 hypothetical protein [Methylophilaceae bacterium]MBL6729037.1 hypothetical protein [Methylophilaceae bacterium]